MAQLIVMRHAKAVERLEAEDDFERSLTDRGRADAARAADAMRRLGLSADRALVSPSRRTRETWACIAETLGEPTVHDPMALYHASPSMLERAVLEALDAGGQRLAVVGHNPGVGALAHGLADRAGALSGLPQGWPTSAWIALEIKRDDGRLTAFRRVGHFNPKD